MAYSITMFKRSKNVYVLVEKRPKYWDKPTPIDSYMLAFPFIVMAVIQLEQDPMEVQN